MNGLHCNTEFTTKHYIVKKRQIKQYSLKTKIVIVSYQKNIYINKYKMITMKMG